MWYHVLNRGNRRATVFHKPFDYNAFVKAMSDATSRLPVDLLGYCLMPNHFHLVICTHADGDLGRWVRWLLVAHAQRYHRHYHTTGHVWQGRYEDFPVQEDDHLVSVLSYVERNALRGRVGPACGGLEVVEFTNLVARRPLAVAGRCSGTRRELVGAGQ
jgi:putative transposase